MIGRTVAHYKILEKLGEGGMGEVYLAEDTELGRRVALKFLPGRAAGDAGALARFKREAQAAAALNHPNIVTIHEIGKHEDRPYIAMSYIDGGTLRNEIAKGIEVERAVDVILQACEGLEKAHRAGIVHRDIKPENLISDSDGRVKILDFGVATFNEPGTAGSEAATAGTVHYMSPEQARGDTLDARSDVFSLGTILYEMLAGTRPFAGAHTSAVQYSILNEDPAPLSQVRPGVDPALERVVARATAKNPDERYASAAELAGDLRALRDGRAAGAGKTARWRRFALPALVVVAALVLFYVFGPFGDGSPGDGGAGGEDDRVAIMYFDNLAQEDDPNRLGEIITDLLITDLSRFGDLRVVSHQRLYDVLKLRGKEDTKTIDRTTATEVARAAGARWMMLGSILQVDPNLVVTTQLVDVESGTVEASQRLTGAPGETVFTLVDRMTGQTRDELNVTSPLGAEPSISIADVTTNSLDAYRAYVEGIDYENKLYLTEAMDRYRRAIELDSTFAMAHYRYAVTALNANDFTGALAAMQTAARNIDRVSDRERRHIAAFTAMTQLRFDEGLSRLKEITERYPDDKNAHFTLAAAYYNLGSAEGAAEEFRKVLELDPFHKQSYNMLAYTYDRLGEFEKSIEAINRYIELSPGEANPYDTRADLYAYNGELEQAIASYKKALEVKPDFLPSTEKLGHMYLYQGRYEDAAEQYRTLAAGSEPAIRSTGRTHRAVIELYRGHLREGLEVLEAGLAADEMEGFYADSYLFKQLLRGSTYAELGRFETTDEIAAQVLPIVKRSFPMLFRVVDLMSAYFHAQYGQVAQADSLIALHARHTDTFDSNTLSVYNFARGTVSLKNNRPDAAVRYLELSDSLVADQYLTRYWLSRAYLEANRSEKAIALLETILQRYDESRLQDPLKAVEGIYYLGRAYEKAGETGKAAGTYRTFLDIWKDADPELEKVADAEKRLAALETR